MTDPPATHRSPVRADEDGWLREFISRHGTVVLKLALSQVGPDLADDVAAETFETAWRERGSFDPELGSERAWIVGVTLNRCRSHRRSLKRWRARTASAPLDTDDMRHHPDAAVDRIDASRLKPELMRALERLPRAQRETLLLTAIAGLEPSEIATLLKIPASTVRSNLRRARLAVSPSVEGRLS